MKKNSRLVITMMAIFIWCGMIYPELSFPRDVLCILSDGEPEQELWTPETYYSFLEAEPEQIEIKSRLAEWIENIR